MIVIIITPRVIITPLVITTTTTIITIIKFKQSLYVANYRRDEKMESVRVERIEQILRIYFVRAVGQRAVILEDGLFEFVVVGGGGEPASDGVWFV